MDSQFPADIRPYSAYTHVRVTVVGTLNSSYAYMKIYHDGAFINLWWNNFSDYNGVENFNMPEDDTPQNQRLGFKWGFEQSNSSYEWIITEVKLQYYW